MSIRLTLRTLLAYLDDVLPAEDAREIGQRLGDSPYAAALVNRIRDVVKRRRLTAPALAGPGSDIDPNQVAEYLDNVLTPDEVIEVERVCLASNIHLAEVAAIHQVLTLVLGEPSEVPAAIRERMYGLARGEVSDRPRDASKPATESKPTPTPATSTSPAITKRIVEELAAARTPSETAPARGVAAGATTAAAPRPTTAQATASAHRSDDPVDRLVLSTAGPTAKEAKPDPVDIAPSVETSGEMVPFEQMLPESLKTNSASWGKSMPYAVVAVLALVWIGLLLVDSPLTRKSAPEANAPATAGNGEETLVANHLKGASPAGTDAPSGEGEPVGTPRRLPRDASTLPGHLDDMAATRRPTPTGDAVPTQTEPSLTGPGTTTPKSPVTAPSTGTTAPETSGSPASLTKSPSTPETPTTPASTAPKVALPVYLSVDAVLLTYDPTARNWTRIAPRTELPLGAVIAVPEPYQAALQIERSGAQLHLHGGTIARLGSTPAGGALLVHLHRGRIVLTTPPGADAEPEPTEPASSTLKLALQTGTDLWHIESASHNGLFAADVVLREPMQFEQDFEKTTYSGGLYVLRGDLQIRDAQSRETKIHEAGWVPLTPLLRVENALPPPESGSLTTPADRWISTNVHATTLKNYGKVFEKYFAFRKTGGDVSNLELDLVSTAQDRRPEISRLATEALALMEAHASLVDLLKRSEHEESRRAALHGLRRWLPLIPENRDLLREELAKQFSPADSDIVYRLLWGVSETDARSHEYSSELVQLLDHQEIAIRELAFHFVQVYTNNAFDYRPNASAMQRQLSIKRINQHIKTTGLLPPLANP